MKFQGRDLDHVSNYSLPFPSAFVWFPWGLRKDDQSLQVGEGEAGTELSLQTGWWPRLSTIPLSRFLAPHPHPRRRVRQVEGGLPRGDVQKCPRMPLPARCLTEGSCSWLASLCSPRLQACVFLEVMEMHFLKMLSNTKPWSLPSSLASQKLLIPITSSLLPRPIRGNVTLTESQ